MLIENVRTIVLSAEIESMTMVAGPRTWTAGDTSSRRDKEVKVSAEKTEQLTTVGELSDTLDGMEILNSMGENVDVCGC